MAYARIIPKTKEKERRAKRRSFSSKISLHPLFIAVGVIYALQGDLFVFLLNCIVAVQHELAHAFASAKLGYAMQKIVLMPFGAVIEGDLSKIGLKDEITVAISGPLCNLFTAFFFGALWWFYPTVYAFTDTAYYTSLSIALVNLLPAYPLDGGRILRAGITVFKQKRGCSFATASKKAYAFCKAISLILGVLFASIGIVLFFARKSNISLFVFGLFLTVSAFQITGDSAYAKLDFSQTNALKKGVVVRRVAVSEHTPIKDVFRFIQRDFYLVLDAYTTEERLAFSLTQNQLHALFLQAETPYDTLSKLQGKIPPTFH